MSGGSSCMSSGGSRWTTHRWPGEWTMGGNGGGRSNGREPETCRLSSTWWGRMRVKRERSGRRRGSRRRGGGGTSWLGGCVGRRRAWSCRPKGAALQRQRQTWSRSASAACISCSFIMRKRKAVQKQSLLHTWRGASAGNGSPADVLGRQAATQERVGGARLPEELASAGGVALGGGGGKRDGGPGGGAVSGATRGA